MGAAAPGPDADGRQDAGGWHPERGRAARRARGPRSQLAAAACCCCCYAAALYAAALLPAREVRGPPRDHVRCGDTVRASRGQGGRPWRAIATAAVGAAGGEAAPQRCSEPVAKLDALPQCLGLFYFRGVAPLRAPLRANGLGAR